MPSQHFAPAPYKEPAKADLRGGMSFQDVAAKYHLSERSTRRYLKEVEEEQSGKKQVPSAPGGRMSKEGGKLAAVTNPQPAATVFTLGNQTILIDPADLYESFLLYEDLRVKIPLDQPFSSVLKDGVAILWEVLAKNPVNQKPDQLAEEEKELVEVTHDDSSGDGKAETGAQ